jgi:DNA-binding response OmpR family regulator
MEVLAVEDDVFSRKLLCSMIEKMGHDVVVAENGVDALKILSGGFVKIAVLDWNLPEMSGLDVCKKIREKDFKIPPYIIMATAANIKKENVIETLRAGANDYLEKPYDAEELKAALKTAEKVISLQLDLEERIRELQKAVDEIKLLRGILPICMGCGKIRTDRESWEKIEEYLSKHIDIKFSFGLCPDCIEKNYDKILKK